MSKQPGKSVLNTL